MKEVWYGADRNQSVVHANICMTSNFLYVTLFVISECFASCQHKSYSAKTYASFIPEPEQWRVVPCFVARWLANCRVLASFPVVCTVMGLRIIPANVTVLTARVQYQDSLYGICGAARGTGPGLSQILRISHVNPPIQLVYTQSSLTGDDET